MPRVTDRCRRRDLALLAAASFVLRLPALLSSRWYDPDEAAIAVQGATLTRGGRLYVDMADRKPPIPPYLVELWHWISGAFDPRGPRLIVSAMLAVAAVAVAVEVARTHGRRVALWTAWLYVTASFALVPADGGAANYAHVALPLATLALLAIRRGGPAQAGGGLLLGLAILSRQSWVFAVPAAVGGAWLQSRWRGAARVAAGVAAGVAGAALLAPWSDYWFWNFTSSTGFVFAGTSVGGALLTAIGSTALFCALHLVAVGALGRLAATRVAAGVRSFREDADLWVWLLTGLAATAAGFRFYGHYWLQVVPPLVLLTGPVVAGWAPRWRTVAAGLVGATAAFALAAQVVPGVFRERPSPTAVARRIDECTTASGSVFIWGSYPELAMAVDRPIAGTLVHSDFVTGRSGGRQAATDAATPGARERMMDDLLADPPAVLVDTAGVTDLGYGAFPLPDDPDLGPYAAAGYKPEQFDGFVLWWAAGTPCAATTGQ